MSTCRMNQPSITDSSSSTLWYTNQGLKKYCRFCISNDVTLALVITLKLREFISQAEVGPLLKTYNSFELQQTKANQVTFLLSLMQKQK
jgi:hypothetical protein